MKLDTMDEAAEARRNLVRSDELPDLFAESNEGAALAERIARAKELKDAISAIPRTAQINGKPCKLFTYGTFAEYRGRGGETVLRISSPTLAEACRGMRKMLDELGGLVDVIN